MPVNIGLLPSAALTGLTEDQQNNLQNQATTQFLLGTLLTGDPSMGYKGAIGLPEQALSAQSRLLDLQEKERQRQEENQFTAKYNPTVYQEGNPAFTGPVNPDQLQQQESIKAARASGRSVVDPSGALRDLMTLRSPRVPQMLSALQAGLPKAVEGGNIIGPNAEYLGTLPQIFSNQGLMSGASVVNGKIVPYSLEIPNAVAARSRMTEAEKAAGAKFEFEPVIENGQTVLRSKYQLSGADNSAALERAKGDLAGLSREISQVNRLSDNDPTKQQRLAILNQEIAKAQDQVKNFGGQSSAPVKSLSAPEAAYQGGWEKIRDNAYKGYEIATGRSGTLQSLQNIMNRPDFDTNAFSSYKNQLAGILNASGIATDQQKNYLNSSANFRQGLNTIAAQSVSELSGSTSNFDLEFSQGRFATLKDTKQANQYAIDLLAAADARKKDYYNFVNNNRTPDVNQKWQESNQGKTSLFESAPMRKYLPQSTVTDGPYKGQKAYKMPNGEVKVFPN
jgi:hypothetical protein